MLYMLKTFFLQISVIIVSFWNIVSYPNLIFSFQKQTYGFDLVTFTFIHIISHFITSPSHQRQTSSLTLFSSMPSPNRFRFTGRYNLFDWVVPTTKLNLRLSSPMLLVCCRKLTSGPTKSSLSSKLRGWCRRVCGLLISLATKPSLSSSMAQAHCCRLTVRSDKLSISSSTIQACCRLPILLLTKLILSSPMTRAWFHRICGLLISLRTSLSLCFCTLRAYCHPLMVRPTRFGLSSTMFHNRKPVTEQ